jgi:hypothetical protein
MAGIKITDLAALTVADAADYLCIVDVSDTSQSAAGTTKKIEVDKFATSGSWTPTFSDFSGPITAATLTSATYQRVGNIVTGYINVDITFDFSAATDGSFEFTYPFATASTSGGGNVSSIFVSQQINGGVKENVIHLLSEDTTLTGTFAFYAIFQYEIN